MFNLTKHWKNYDIFARQKMDTFRSSRNAVVELAERYKELVTSLEADKNETKDEEAEKLIFAEMFEICLWGNATDLSLLTSLTYEDIQKLQGSEARKSAEKNILINDLPKAYDALKKAKAEGKTERRVDIVLDNAGFELYVDLILAGYLLATGLATQIVIRPKSIPWFVSDVLPSDFSALLNALSYPRTFFDTQSEDEKLQDKIPTPLTNVEEENLKFLFQHWAQLHAEGQLIMRPNRYWTAGGSFWRLPKEEPELFDDLKTAELTVFKGDLNYRKLTADVSIPLERHLFLVNRSTHADDSCTGPLGYDHAFRRGHRALGSWLRHQRTVAENLQGRRRGRLEARTRRRTQEDWRRHRNRRKEMGVARQVGRGVLLRWKELVN